VTEGWPALALILGDVAAVAVAPWILRAPPPGLVRENYARRRVPAVLGAAMVVGVVVSVPVTASLAGDGYQLGTVGVGALLGFLGLGAVGLLDDLLGGEARGFRGHLGRLRRGRPTTGILKLAAGVGAGTAVAFILGGGPVRVAAAAVLMALAANLWNALDVVPGRALKLGILALLPLLLASWREPAALLAAAGLGASVAVLPFDLLERGMLGDAGSNPLGFLVGLGLAVVLPTAGVVAAAAAGLLLQVSAETVTISRLIEATPPLRWLDRLGRVA
jgi:UDP-N-acetylmuramyl pentapeptide phosphotransferase/UDP-N-acetylglucosamine-1-phosphate transferase